VVFEVLLDGLLGEVLDEVHFVEVVGVVGEGGAEVGAADADGGYLAGFEQFLGGGCVLVAQVDAWLDEVDLGVLLGAQALVVKHLDNLFVIALFADPILLIILLELLSGAALVAFK
jgi:hypothetical protein